MSAGGQDPVERLADRIVANWARIGDRSGDRAPESGAAEYQHEVQHGRTALLTDA